jgi:hypothetical protein
MEEGNVEEDTVLTAPIVESKKGNGGYKRKRIPCEENDVVIHAMEKLKPIENKGVVYVESDIFKDTSELERVITKPKSKNVSVKLFPEKFLNDNPKTLSQKFPNPNFANRVKERVVHLLNCIGNDKLLIGICYETPEFSQNRHVDALISVLTTCAKTMRVGPNDFRIVANLLVEDYEGQTIHDLIRESDPDISSLVPVGTRSSIGTIAKRNICAFKDITPKFFDMQHMKVNVEYSEHLF